MIDHSHDFPLFFLPAFLILHPVNITFEKVTLDVADYNWA